MKMKALLIILICFYSALIAETGMPSSQKHEASKEFGLFFKQVKTIPLSEEKVLLGSVRVLRIAPDGNFWILDSRGIKIDRYKPDGTFISSIGASGQGPGEYLAPMDIFIGKEYIYVVDDVARKLNVLNMDGTFKYHFSIQDGRKVQESKTGDIVIAAPLVTTPDSSTCIQIYNKKGELKKAFVPVSRNALKNNLFSDLVSFSLDEEDNIYCVQEMEYKIYKYSFSGQLLKSFSQIKPYYTPPPDTPFKQKHLRSAAEKWIKSWTQVIGIMYYNKLLFVTLMNRESDYEYIMDIYSTEGDFIKGGLAANYRLLNIDNKGQFYFLEDKEAEFWGEAAQVFNRADVGFWGITTERDRNRIQEFKSEYQLTFPIFFDEDGMLKKQIYAIAADLKISITTPFKVFVNQDREIIRIEGPEKDVEKQRLFLEIVSRILSGKG